MKRTALARTSELRQRVAMKRTAASVKRHPAREALGRAAVRSAVFNRDGWRCMLHSFSPCHGELTPHHLRKSSQGGQYDERNLTTLCSYHNDYIEDHPKAAWKMGFVVRRGDTHEAAAERRALNGFVA